MRGFGTHHLELIEDAVQEAMVAALASWGRGGMPSRPVAWLQQVARNRLIDELRKQHPRDPLPPGLDDPGAGPDAALACRRELPDDLLRMLFLCADEQLPAESQLVLALKVVCGFTTDEIARRLFTSEANVYKRLQRGRDLLRARGAPGELSQAAVLQGRGSAVRQMIYLLFNEGYSSACADQLVRRELCDEALYLGSVLAAHPAGDHPETWALLALMAFHFARLDARTDGTGGLLLLEEQDRSLWDRDLIAQAFRWLSQSATGDSFSRYHAEAAIAAEHCLAPTFAETRWQEVIDLYEILERHEPSPLHTLNRAIAVAQLHGPAVGAGDPARHQAAGLAARLLPLGRGAGRAGAPGRQPRPRPPALAARAGGGPHPRRAGPAETPPAGLRPCAPLNGAHSPAGTAEASAASAESQERSRLASRRDHSSSQPGRVR